MASKKNTRKKSASKAPESLLPRHASAYLLLILGVLLFLAVLLHMQGVFFDLLRSFSFGLTGAFSFLLPLFPIYLGISLLLPSRKGNARTTLLVLLFYLLLLACAILFTYTSYGAMGRVSLMESFAYHSTGTGSFSDMLSQAFEFCSGGRVGISGGLIGTMIAWPLWKVLGNDLAGVICILAMIWVVLSLFRIDVIGIFQSLHLQAMKTHQERSEEREKREEEIARQQREWQQAHAVRAATRQEFTAQPAPEQFSGKQKVVPGFAQTPEEQPDYVPKPTAKRSAFSRIFDNPAPEPAPKQPAHPMPAKQTMQPVQPVQAAATAPEVPAAQPVNAYSPEEAWQQSQMSSPFRPAEPEKASIPVPEPVNPHQLTGPNTPAAAFPGAAPMLSGYAPQPLTPVSEPEPVQVQETPAPKQGQRLPTAWQSAVSDRLKETEQTETVAPAETPIVESTGKLKPQNSFYDTATPVDTSSRVQGEVILPVTNAPSTWQPELEIASPGKKATYGQEMDEDDEEYVDPETLPIPYIFPDPSLLKEPDPSVGISPEEDAIRSKRLEETLASFKIQCQVKHVTHGPAISRFELELAAGIKVSKITDLGPNIAMNMEVKSVRIEAPIPGKSLVGVEVPNRKVATVTLKEVLSSEKMVKAKDPLVVALGRDIAGAPVICNLARMPHLLIAGATGSGKSVCINTIINSLLYRTSPDQVRLILVDPKVVELQCYNGIPHLLAPVVSDPHKAAGALQWAVEEMMRRYAVFQEAGVRNLEGYNGLLGEGEKPMPRIVIIIDELADLMMTCKREVEEYICRIAQLARAAGIHLIVATQRPSVDVITGLIKANIPSRIAFKVSSFIDSRTILDKNGAEQLLGYGDMLYQPMGEFTPTRVQGCFLSDSEVNAITDFIRKTSSAEYDESFVAQLSKIENDSGMAPPDMIDGSSDAGSDNSLLEQCIEIALMDKQISTSLLQRRLKIGYARAGRLVDEMEKRGIVSAKDGAKPRICLITREEYEQMKQSGTMAT
ncbi:MAG: hypothetical protein IJ229_06495 [Clostridia bacterium]|nr:hypothetical protein [Clostridia bacterium]